MEILIDKKQSSYGIISATVSPGDYLVEYNKKLKEYAKNANMKGFRPGKVPPGLIKKMYGADLLMSIFNEIINEALNNFMEEKGELTAAPPFISPDSLVTVEQLESKEDLSLNFNALLVPSDLSIDYAEVQVTKYIIDIIEEDIDKEIDSFLKEKAKIVDVEEVSEGTFVKLKAAVAGLDLELEGTIPTSRLSAAALESFKGKKVEDKLTIPVEDLLEEFQNLRMVFSLDEDDLDDLNGENFDITIVAIDKEEKAELTEELLAEQFPDADIKSEDDLRAHFKTVLEEAYNESLASVFYREVLDNVLKKFDAIDFPEEIVLQLHKLHQSRSDEEKQMDETEEELEENLKNLTKHLSRQSYFAILGKELEKSGSTVTDEDIKKASINVTNRMVSGMGLSQQFGDVFLMSIAQNLMNDPGERGDSFRQEVQSEAQMLRLARFLSEKVTVIEESVTIKKVEEIFRTTEAKIAAEDLVEETAETAENSEQSSEKTE